MVSASVWSNSLTNQVHVIYEPGFIFLVIYKNNMEERMKVIMFEIDDNYIKEINANYWEEENEMKAGVHPSQIIERVEKELIKSGNKGKITFMDYNGFSGTRVGVSVNNSFYGVFDYIENAFESTPESRLIETLETLEMGAK